MSGVSIVTKTGPRSYSPASGQTITGGQLVEATTGGRIKAAASGSVKVLGVALTDAIAPEDVTTTASGTPPTLVAVPQPTRTAVAYGHVEVPVTYAANATFGQLLVAAADGKVTPAAEFDAEAPTDPALIIGRCTEPNGVTVATNPVGLARITV